MSCRWATAGAITWRRAALTQVTRDQTLAQDMVDPGLIPASAAERSPLSHVLSQAVGGSKESEISPTISSLRPRSPATPLLLCTDGLTKHVAEAPDCRGGRAGAESAKAACDHVGGGRRWRDGGSDNVTVVVARFTDSEAWPRGSATS